MLIRVINGVTWVETGTLFFTWSVFTRAVMKYVAFLKIAEQSSQFSMTV